MIQSKLRAIRGLRVSEADLTSGDAGLRFENGATLNVYNKFVVTGTSGAGSVLKGKTVEEVKEDASAVRILFSEGVELQIDLRDNAYNGPEAMQLRVPGKPIVVWN